MLKWEIPKVKFSTLTTFAILKTVSTWKLNMKIWLIKQGFSNLFTLSVPLYHFRVLRKCAHTISFPEKGQNTAGIQYFHWHTHLCGSWLHNVQSEKVYMYRKYYVWICFFVNCPILGNMCDALNKLGFILKHWPNVNRIYFCPIWEFMASVFITVLLRSASFPWQCFI